MVLVYMLTWRGYIDGIHITVYSIHGSYGEFYGIISKSIEFEISKLSKTDSNMDLWLTYYQKHDGSPNHQIWIIMNNLPLPSGELIQLLKITIFNGKIHCKSPFSIAFCMFTRGYSQFWDVTRNEIPGAKSARGSCLVKAACTLVASAMGQSGQFRKNSRASANQRSSCASKAWTCVDQLTYQGRDQKKWDSFRQIFIVKNNSCSSAAKAECDKNISSIWSPICQVSCDARINARPVTLSLQFDDLTIWE